MEKYPISMKSKKTFLKWCSRGDSEYQDGISYALESLIPMIEEAGFEWVDKTPDGFKNPPFYVIMSRTTESGYESISLNFNKYRKLKLSIDFAVSDPSRNYTRVVMGNLVPRKKREYRQYWWGASLISLDKQHAFKKDVNRVIKILPQIIDFLTNGTLGENIWVSNT